MVLYSYPIVCCNIYVIVNKIKIWNSLSFDVQKAIIKGANKELKGNYSQPNFFKKIVGISSLNNEALENIFSVKELMLGGCENLTDISFIHHFRNVEKLYLWGTKVADITSLQSLPNLKELYASGTKIRSYEPIKNSKLTLLYNSFSGADDYYCLSRIKTLKKLELSHNQQLINLEPFSELQDLEMIHIANTVCSAAGSLSTHVRLPRA